MFYIGDVLCDPPVILAPMAAITNPPFRILCKEMGAGLVVSEMVSARALYEDPASHSWRLEVLKEEHPIAIQIFGGDSKYLVPAAQKAENKGADIVDLNMGCPMKKVVQNGYGAALLLDPEKVYTLIKEMVDAVNIPVTAKIRSGWKDANIYEVVHAIEEAGGAAIAIHGRTRSEMFEGRVDREIIADVKKQRHIPIIANGDIRDAQSAISMIQETNCDAIMVARGAMGYPWIFRELAAALNHQPIPPMPTLEERQKIVLRHLSLYYEKYGEFRTLMEFRKHLLWYFWKTPAEKVLRNSFVSFTSLFNVHKAIEKAVDACQNAKKPFNYPRGLEKHPNRRQQKR